MAGHEKEMKGDKEGRLKEGSGGRHEKERRETWKKGGKKGERVWGEEEGGHEKDMKGERQGMKREGKKGRKKGKKGGMRKK